VIRPRFLTARRPESAAGARERATG
jgi:hypothetical protein